MNNYKGKLLIAKPILKDPFFSKSVIYVTEYQEEKGTVGFILNKLNGRKLSQLVPTIKKDWNVYTGGPVNQDHIFVMHSRPDLIKEGICVDKNVYCSGDYDQITAAINNELISKDEIKFFVGYSGWGEKQLEKELGEEDWLVYDDAQLNIFNCDDNLWKNELIKIDKTNIIWLNSPINPDLN